MKKISSRKNEVMGKVAIHIAIFVFLFGFSLIAIQHTASAAALKTKFTVPEYCNQPGRECGWLELVKLGSEILSFGIYIAVLGATLVIVVAGWKIMTAGGDEGAVKTGKKMLWAAIVGIIVTMCAYLLVQFILNKLGVIDGVRVFI
jgi:hypothetical protein